MYQNKHLKQALAKCSLLRTFFYDKKFNRDWPHRTGFFIYEIHIIQPIYVVILQSKLNLKILIQRLKIIWSYPVKVAGVSVLPVRRQVFAYARSLANNQECHSHKN